MILKIFNFILILSVFVLFIPLAKAEVVTLYNEDSYDFSTNMRGHLSGGDFYFGDSTVSGKFWANNLGQRGLQDLGDIGLLYFNEVSIPASGYYQFGVLAVVNHTYVSLAQEGEEGNHIIFRVCSLAYDNSYVIIDYFYSQGVPPTPASTPTLTPTQTISPSPSPTQPPEEPPTVMFIAAGVLGIVVVVLAVATFLGREK